MLQNMAGIEALAGDAGGRRGSWDLLTGATEPFLIAGNTPKQGQGTRIMEQLRAAIPSPELAGLLKEGESSAPSRLITLQISPPWN